MPIARRSAFVASFIVSSALAATSLAAQRSILFPTPRGDTVMTSWQRHAPGLSVGTPTLLERWHRLPPITRLPDRAQRIVVPNSRTTALPECPMPVVRPDSMSSLAARPLAIDSTEQTRAAHGTFAGCTNPLDVGRDSATTGRPGGRR